MTPDEKKIHQCIALAKESLQRGEAPFACIITKGDDIIAESINGSKNRVSDHAEVLALDKAHQFTGTPNLSGCTLYAICEPCPMCSFMIREYKMSKVVFSLPSPFVGGYSKWPILQDKTLAQFDEFFSQPPEVVSGIFQNEAKKIFDAFGLWMFGDQTKHQKQ